MTDLCATGSCSSKTENRNSNIDDRVISDAFNFPDNDIKIPAAEENRGGRSTKIGRRVILSECDEADGYDNLQSIMTSQEEKAHSEDTTHCTAYQPEGISCEDKFVLDTASNDNSANFRFPDDGICEEDRKGRSTKIDGHFLYSEGDVGDVGDTSQLVMSSQEEKAHSEDTTHSDSYEVSCTNNAPAVISCEDKFVLDTASNDNSANFRFPDDGICEEDRKGRSTKIDGHFLYSEGDVGDVGDTSQLVMSSQEEKAHSEDTTHSDSYEVSCTNNAPAVISCEDKFVLDTSAKDSVCEYSDMNYGPAVVGDSLGKAFHDIEPIKIAYERCQSESDGGSYSDNFDSSSLETTDPTPETSNDFGNQSFNVESFFAPSDH